MSEPTAFEGQSLLNVFDVGTQSGPRRLLCFVEPGRASTVGIDPRVIVGEFPSNMEGTTDASRLQVNPAFVETFTVYMNTVASQTPGLVEQASQSAGRTLFVVDPRTPPTNPGEPAPHDVLGAFEVGDDGKIIAGSFQYNPGHAWFEPKAGISGVFSDQTFYGWLHPATAPPAEAP